jgi:Phosphatidylglycerophosphate synthase
MLDLYLRKIKERAMRLVAGLVPSFLTPNHLTLLGFLLGLVCCYYLYIGNYAYGLIYWAINRLLDGIDGKREVNYSKTLGVVARRRSLQSDFGGYLDIICDFTVP